MAPAGKKTQKDLLKEVETLRQRIKELEKAETAHQITEAALRDSEQRYRQIVETAHEGIWSIDEDSKTIFVNNRLAEMLGYPPEEMIGKSLNAFMDEQWQDKAKNFIESERASQGSSGQYDFKFRRKDGSELWAIVTTSPTFDDQGNFTGILGMLTDITARKWAEETLRFTQFSVDYSASHISWVGPDGRYLYVNDAFCNSLGFSREELLSMKVWDINPEFSDNGLWTEHWQKVKRKRSLTLETKHKTKAGSFIPVEITINHLDYIGKEFHITIGRDVSERKSAEVQIRRQVDRLAALRTIDLAITSSLDLRVTFNILLDQTTSQLNVDAADILLLNPSTYRLEFAEGRGFQTTTLKHTNLALGKGYAGIAALERRVVNISNLGKDGRNFLKSSPLLAEEGFISYFGVPLIAKGQVKGVLEIFHRSTLQPDQEWLDFLQALSGQAAIAIDNAMLFNDLQRTNIDLVQSYDITLEGWSRALDLRDKETEGHSERVTEMTLRLAREMKIPNDEIIHLRRGALLHDIGKVGIPDSILHKAGPLSKEEREIMRMHPVYAYELLWPIPFLRPAIDIPYCHHERWDGSGYPRGLKEDQIPLSAQIFIVADVWDALRSERPYRPTWGEEEAREYIRQQSGQLFNPKVVEMFLRIIDI